MGIGLEGVGEEEEGEEVGVDEVEEGEGRAAEAVAGRSVMPRREGRELKPVDSDVRKPRCVVSVRRGSRLCASSTTS
jgi:hypothetical protein